MCEHWLAGHELAEGRDKVFCFVDGGFLVKIIELHVVKVFICWGIIDVIDCVFLVLDGDSAVSVPSTTRDA